MAGRSRPVDGSSDEPLRLVRLVGGGLLLFGTVVAVALALTGVEPRALRLVGMFWAIYGLISGLTSGVFEPAIDGLRACCRARPDAGGGGFSAVEALWPAATSPRLPKPTASGRSSRRRPGRGDDPPGRAAGRPAGAAGDRAGRLQALRAHPLPADADLRVGVALVDVYERRMSDPDRAWSSFAGSSISIRTGGRRCVCGGRSRCSRTTTSDGAPTYRVARACDPTHSGPFRLTYLATQ